MTHASEIERSDAVADAGLFCIIGASTLRRQPSSFYRYVAATRSCREITLSSRSLTPFPLLPQPLFVCESHVIF
jgi:hypothetical protein